MTDMHLVFIAMFGVIGALIAIALLLGIGTLIVRRLRLPDEPPFDVYFCAPAPELVSVPNREQAQATAAQQAERQEVLQKARYLCMHALKCSAAYQALDAIAEKSKEEKDVVKKLKPIYQKLKDIPETMEAWYKDSGLEAHRQDIERWHQQHHQRCEEWEAILDGLPPPDRKRMYLLIVALFASIGLLALANILAHA